MALRTQEARCRTACRQTRRTVSVHVNTDLTTRVHPSLARSGQQTSAHEMLPLVLNSAHSGRQKRQKDETARREQKARVAAAQVCSATNLPSKLGNALLVHEA